jgi:predicted Zn-dependent peptidase
MSDYTYYGFSPHVSNLARAMELFAIFFIEPTFPEIELERGIILEECLEDLNEQGVDVDINNLACKLLYKDDMLACPTIGTEDTIREVTVEMLREHFRTFYVPGNMVLAGAGRVDHDVFLKLASKHFSNLAEGGRVISNGHFEGSLDETQSQPEVLFQHDSDSQVQLQICFRSVSYNHPDYFVVNLIARIFDDGVTSRLQKILREERGLVYSVECRATSLPDTGTLDFDVSVRSEKVVEVTKILLGEVKTLVGSGAEDEELDCIKRRYGYDLDYEPDDPYKQIMRYGFCHLYSREYSAEEERESIGRITAQDIQRVAEKIFIPENLNFVLVGPHTPQLKKELEDIVRNF